MNGEQSAAGATSIAPSNTQYAPSLSNRASPFPPTTTSSTMATMAAPVFAPQASAFRPSLDSHHSYKLGMGAGGHGHNFDRDATTKPIGTPYSSAPSPPSPASVIIQGLPLNTSEESLRLMAVFSHELVGVQMLPVDQSVDVFRSAIMTFKSQAGAHQARDILHGKPNINNDADLSVDLLPGNPAAGRRLTVDAAVSGSSSAASSATSSGPNSRQPSRFNGTFHSLEKISPPMNGMYAPTELPNPESSARYQNLFSPQSPIGNHLSDMTRISGKTLIKDVVDDEDTGELLKDPVAYAESGATGQRRATAPQLPISSRMAGLSLNTTSQGPPPMPPYNHASMSAMSAHSATMSPIMGGGGSVGGRGMDYQVNRHFNAKRHNFPPANPADQNPPCNTLYVGNLPIDTSEEELKAMFSKQRGYKRLCFRTKQNGPMCFVEFEDVSFATKALHELYGQPLHNSVKGGIRLSFSKNPLGVRSGQTPGYGNVGGMNGMTGIMSGPGNGFSNASGPPPGLSAPPGLSSRTGSYGATTSAGSNGYTVASYPPSGSGWGASTYNSNSNSSNNMSAGGPGAIGSGSSNSASSYLPPHMMGR